MNAERTPEERIRRVSHPHIHKLSGLNAFREERGGEPEHKNILSYLPHISDGADQVMERHASLFLFPRGETL
jgi:hypothetical protein